MTRRRRSFAVLTVSLAVYLLSQAALNALVRTGVEPADDPVFADHAALLAGRPEFFAPSHPGRRLLVLGSSRSRHGIDTGQLATELGCGAVAFNFATPAAGPLTNTLYWHRLQALGLQVDEVILEIHPGYLATGSPPFEARWLRPSRLRAGEADRLTALGHPTEEPAHLGVRGWCAATSVYRAGLLGRHSPSFHSHPNGLPVSRTDDPHGFVPGPTRRPDPAGKGLAATFRQYADVFADYRVGGVGCVALEQLCADIRASGVRVRVLMTPESPALQARYGPAGNRQLAEYVVRLEEVSGHPVIAARNWLAEADFVDGHHATPTGARKWTAYLADELRGPSPLTARARP